MLGVQDAELRAGYISHQPVCNFHDILDRHVRFNKLRCMLFPILPKSELVDSF